MQLTSQEEYGLRCLLTVARQATEDVPVGIPDIASAEGLSPEYAAKLMRLLRQGGLVTSTRGASGGYRLVGEPASVSIWSVIEVLGGPLFSESFCASHTGRHDDCVHQTSPSGCSIRVMWQWIGSAVRGVLMELTLADLMQSEQSITEQFNMVQLPTVRSTVG